MELSPYVSALRENLTAAAAAGDEQTRTAARVLAATIEPAARLAIMTALSDLAGEVTLALEDRVVEVRLDGQDVQVVVTGAPNDQVPEDEPPPTMTDPNGDISRITVRLLEELKTKAEEVAAARGVSLNSFVSQAVQGALYNAGRGRGGGGGQNQNWGGGNWGNWGQWGQQSGDNDDRSGRGGRGSSRVRGWVEG
jgi:HicB family